MIRVFIDTSVLRKNSPTDLAYSRLRLLAERRGLEICIPRTVFEEYKRFRTQDIQDEFKKIKESSVRLQRKFEHSQIDSSINSYIKDLEGDISPDELSKKLDRYLGDLFKGFKVFPPISHHIFNSSFRDYFYSEGLFSLEGNRNNREHLPDCIIFHEIFANLGTGNFLLVDDSKVELYSRTTKKFSDVCKNFDVFFENEFIAEELKQAEEELAEELEDDRKSEAIMGYIKSKGVDTKMLLSKIDSELLYSEASVSINHNDLSVTINMIDVTGITFDPSTIERFDTNKFYITAKADVDVELSGYVYHADLPMYGMSMSWNDEGSVDVDLSTDGVVEFNISIELIDFESLDEAELRGIIDSNEPLSNQLMNLDIEIEVTDVSLSDIGMGLEEEDEEN